MSILAAHQNLCNFLSEWSVEGQEVWGGGGSLRKRRTGTTESRARLLLPKAGHPASPSQRLLATFPAAAIGTQARQCAESASACLQAAGTRLGPHQQVSHFWADVLRATS